VINFFNKLKNKYLPKQERDSRISPSQNIISPQNGKVIPLSEVPDEVFAQKILGDGVAIIPDTPDVVSPTDGVVINVFETLHAYGIRGEDGIGILVHIGIDTVELRGEGFESFVKQGQKVKTGQLLARADIQFIKNRGFSVCTPVVITDVEKITDMEYNFGQAKAGESVILVYRKID
jgi:glucose-specific phosphotransferase system IIA component